MAAMYPSSTILSFPTPKTNGLDPKLSAAICRGYNDWLTDFCSLDSSRMKGVAATPIHDVEESVIEINRAVKENSMIAAYIRPNVINGRNLHDAYYDPLYSTLEELNVPLVVHEGTAGGPPGADQRFLGNWVMMHMAAHPLEQMLGSESIVVGGVLERHPKLRVAFLECGCSWLVYWLWRLDEELEAWGWHEVPWLKKKPSEYFTEQCYVSMEGDEPGAKYYVEMHGNDRLLWASDYPHPDAGIPECDGGVPGVGVDIRGDEEEGAVGQPDGVLWVVRGEFLKLEERLEASPGAGRLSVRGVQRNGSRGDWRVSVIS